MSSENRVRLSLGIAATDLDNRLRMDEDDPRPSVRRLADYLRGLAGGFGTGTVNFNLGATKATATLTFTDDPAAGGTVDVAGVTFTARASGAVTDEWNITSGGTAAADAAGNAASVAALVNNHASLSEFLTAEVSAGTVTFTCEVPGEIGNGLVLTETLTNCTSVQFAGGDEGTLYELNLS